MFTYYLSKTAHSLLNCFLSQLYTDKLPLQSFDQFFGWEERLIHLFEGRKVVNFYNWLANYKVSFIQFPIRVDFEFG
jgi:hypothetical protein